jgi:hypothetical protein
MSVIPGAERGEAAGHPDALIARLSESRLQSSRRVRCFLDAQNLDRESSLALPSSSGTHRGIVGRRDRLW